MKMNRRDLLAGIGSLGAGLILSSCASANGRSHVPESPLHQRNEEAGGKEVGAVEDLMREHGILRRALFIYSESAIKLRVMPAANVSDWLQKTARLFRDFGEDYHERKLEEAFIFPAVKKTSSPAAGLVNTLVAQHNRGREITDHILAVTQAAKVTDGEAEKLADAMDSFVRMYRPHAAREDTVVFPAWKDILSVEQFEEMSEEFEEIEHRLFGDNGFDDVVRQVVVIEAELGMTDLAQYTASPVAM